MSHWVELWEKNTYHRCRVDEGGVRRVHLLALTLSGMDGQGHASPGSPVTIDGHQELFLMTAG